MRLIWGDTKVVVEDQVVPEEVEQKVHPAVDALAGVEQEALVEVVVAVQGPVVEEQTGLAVVGVLVDVDDGEAYFWRGLAQNELLIYKFSSVYDDELAFSTKLAYINELKEMCRNL